jgi:hypothetical protein
MIKNEKIPGDIHDHVKLCIYLSPGDLWLLWTSFKSFCAQLNPAERHSPDNQSMRFFGNVSWTLPPRLPRTENILWNAL